MDTVGPPHHNGVLVLTRLIGDDMGKVFKVATDNVVGLLVEVAVSRIHHIGRSQTVVDPLAFSPRLSETARVKATTS